MLKGIQHCWQTRNALALMLLPLSLVFGLLTRLWRSLFRNRLLRSTRLPLPVVVVGNISVGGTGKSPMVVWMAQHLRARGLRPGIVSRGYGGRSRHWPRSVTADDDPQQLGDEPVMIAAQSGCPVSVGPDRVAAAQALLQAHDCDLLIADDGLQHYQLHRDLEIALVDGQRRYGNGLLLPAGPLREPLARLDSVDWRIAKGRAAIGEVAMACHLGDAVSLLDADCHRPLADFRGQTLHAVAAIGNPASFFEMLRQAGLTIIEHPFADHHRFDGKDLRFGDDNPLLMTHKDAVKCRALAQPGHWYVPLLAELPDSFIREFDQAVDRLLPSDRPTGKSYG
jgi:tetraacyldisaccharide 4'-kinase